MKYRFCSVCACVSTRASAVPVPPALRPVPPSCPCRCLRLWQVPLPLPVLAGAVLAGAVPAGAVPAGAVPAGARYVLRTGAFGGTSGALVLGRRCWDVGARACAFACGWCFRPVVRPPVAGASARCLRVRGAVPAGARYVLRTGAFGGTSGAPALGRRRWGAGVWGAGVGASVLVGLVSGRRCWSGWCYGGGVVGVRAAGPWSSRRRKASSSRMGTPSSTALSCLDPAF